MGRGIIGEGPLRNMYKGHMDKAKVRVGLRVGGGDRWGQGGVVEGNGDNCT